MNNVNKAVLSETRKSLHQAVQLVSAVPRNVLPKDPTDGIASLEWNTQLKSLESIPVDSNNELRAGLSFETFTLYLSIGHVSKAAFEMTGKSVDQGMEWLKTELASLNIESESINLDLPYEIESYDYSKELQIDNQALSVLAELYQATAQVLEGVIATWTEAFDIRCWPHHFDLATLIPLETDQDDEIVKSIGVGLSPGDDQINEPYVYVNIWPSVEPAFLEKHKLAAGVWNTEEWSGAVLTYAQLLQVKDPGQSMSEFCEAIMGILRNESTER